jgi:hypothetical protein
VGQEEAINGTVEDDNLDMLIRFERGDDLVQRRNHLRPEDIQGRVIDGRPPVGGRAPFETDPPWVCDAAHVCLQDLAKGI